MQPQCDWCPRTPTWLTVHEIEVIGVIDQKAPTPQRTEWSGWTGEGVVGLPCVLPGWVKKIPSGCFDAKHFTVKSDLMEAARPHQCQRSWWGALRSISVLYESAATTGPDGQMFAGCFNRAVKRNTDFILCAQLKEKLWTKKKGHPNRRSPILGLY